MSQSAAFPVMKGFSLTKLKVPLHGLRYAALFICRA